MSIFEKWRWSFCKKVISLDNALKTVFFRKKWLHKFLNNFMRKTKKGFFWFKYIE
uniref:Uncharacterized protein n=1 Tax=viral metagenome TaxID=1070528 RepID=A0A6C0E8P0_9ZZZZ